MDPTRSNTAASSTTSTGDSHEAEIDSAFYLLTTPSKIDTPLTSDKTTDGGMTSWDS